MGGRGGSYSRSSFLGPRGKAATVEGALAVVNRRYDEGREWQQNCQRCVYAYEMQRRGYDVEAKPRIFDGTDRLPYRYDKNGWPAVMKGMEQVSMPARNTIAKMDAQMLKWGDGARAIVAVRWKGSRKGHVFMAEQINGVTHYVDPQPGKAININHYMDLAIKGKTLLLRVDKATPTDLLEKCVKRRNK